MAVETALSILRADDRAILPPSIVISGPHAYLREYVFDTVRRRMLQQGMKYRGFQVGGADGFDAVLAELREADLFAPARVVGCRVLRCIAAAQSKATAMATIARRPALRPPARAAVKRRSPRRSRRCAVRER